MICDGCGGDNAYLPLDIDDPAAVRCVDCGHVEFDDEPAGPPISGWSPAPWEMDWGHTWGT